MSIGNLFTLNQPKIFRIILLSLLLVFIVGLILLGIKYIRHQSKTSQNGQKINTNNPPSILLKSDFNNYKFNLDQTNLWEFLENEVMVNQSGQVLNPYNRKFIDINTILINFRYLYDKESQLTETFNLNNKTSYAYGYDVAGGMLTLNYFFDKDYLTSLNVEDLLFDMNYIMLWSLITYSSGDTSKELVQNRVIELLETKFINIK